MKFDMFWLYQRAIFVEDKEGVNIVNFGDGPLGTPGPLHTGWLPVIKTGLIMNFIEEGKIKYVGSLMNRVYTNNYIHKYFQVEFCEFLLHLNILWFIPAVFRISYDGTCDFRNFHAIIGHFLVRFSLVIKLRILQGCCLDIDST